MAHKVKIEAVGLTNPTWSVAEAAPGDEVELSVTTRPLTAGQSVELQISHDDQLIAVLTKLTASGAQQKVKWMVPSFPGTAKLTFAAVLREAPSPANGHVTSRGRVPSPKLVVHGFRVSIRSIDAAFAPGLEKLHARISIENPGAVSLRGVIMIFGERYPGNSVLYSEAIAATTTAGDLDWRSWDGTANAGVLAGKLISPEFSPYRIQVQMWLSKGSTLGSLAEAPFEVVIESLELRIQQGLPQAVKDTLKTFLGIGEPSPQGTYAHSGRLPGPKETARLRIPSGGHSVTGDPLDQGGDLVANAYHAAGSSSRWTGDQAKMSRPELPLEIEPRLRSREPGAHPAGRFAQKAIGPLRIEAFADDHYDDTVFKGGNVREKYWKNAVHKVKLGAHNAPIAGGTASVIGLWQARVKIANAADRTINLATIDADFVYALGKSELSVYLGRARLNVGAAGSSSDVEEISTTQIKLRKGLARAGDIVWIVRSDATAVGARLPSQGAAWRNFPPGANCHVHYGGVRGKAPWDLFRTSFSTAPVRAIIGSGAPFPYTANVNVDPDGVGATSERAETRALDSGANEGLAGILFSPSFVAGDSYVVSAATAPVAYARTLGYLSNRPPKKASTGPMTVWRVMTIQTSLRAADVGTKGYPPTVGCIPEVPYATRAASTYYGDGYNMNFAKMNGEMGHFFNEWQVAPLVAPATDVHTDITTAAYIAAHNAATAGLAGGVTIPNAAGIQNFLIQFDHWRAQLPPGVPAADAAAMATIVAALPANTTSAQAMAAAAAALGAGGGGAPAIPVFAGAGGRAWYENWIDSMIIGIAQRILNALTPPVNPPTVMNVVRWPEFYDPAMWASGAPTGGGYTNANIRWWSWNGFALGGGQSYFATGHPDPGVFPHEMAHTLQLVHFSAGNFCWKHHHLLSPDCLMSYGSTRGYIPQPAGAVGVGATVDSGWPDLVPAALPGGAVAPSNPPAAPGSPTIEITVLPTMTHGALVGKGELCGKCGLKLRGWMEETLPVAWGHPDLF